MTSPILVTGGTGTLGRHVVRRLRDVGNNVRVLSRRSHEAEDRIQFMSGDLATGEGILTTKRPPLFLPGDASQLL